jgi:muconolactone delta-isomerase
MNRYLAELFHDPGISPAANAAARQRARETHEILPRLMSEKNVSLTAEYHLDPEHRAILIFEAPSVEAVRDVLVQSGFMQYCDGRIYPVSTLKEALERTKDLKPIV